MSDINAFKFKEQQEYINALVDLRTMVTKALSGDMKFTLSQTTAAPTVAAIQAADVTYDIEIRLENAAGDLHDWYNGKVLLAIADDDSTGVAAIDPTAGERSMVNGVLNVAVTLGQATWTAGKKATLTVSDPATASTGICGVAVADATFVATVAAS